MPRRTAIPQDDPAVAKEVRTPLSEKPAEGQTAAAARTMEEPPPPSSEHLGETGPTNPGEAKEGGSPSPAGTPDEQESRPAKKVTWQFSPGLSLKFAFRIACYLTGRAADKLISAYTRAVTLDRDYLADFNRSGGMAHAQHKRWGKAIPLLEKALAGNPDDGEARLRLSECFAAEGQYEEACRHLERILEADANSVVAVRALGAIHVRQQAYDLAIGYLEKAVRLDPEHALTWYRLGMACDNKKRYEQAIESFKKAIRLDPRLAKAYQALGFTYESMGNRDSAVECFKKALELE